ncbi:hypothetical protein ACIF6L_31705 [Kitasatospora sp. NPDC086009]|uniref:hypothetical protein n=1 Tax=unclassified Kitasatospora TaxID=2633591 RepID=UPI0036E22597
MKRRILATTLASAAVVAGLVMPTAATASATTTVTAGTTASAQEAGTTSPVQVIDIQSCPDAHQIGSTAYIKFGSETAASVKQYYSPSCKANFGYTYEWTAFRNAHPGLWIGAGVAVRIPGTQGWDLRGHEYTTAQEVWSDGTLTAAACTAGWGNINYNSGMAALTSERC